MAKPESSHDQDAVRRERAVDVLARHFECNDVVDFETLCAEHPELEDELRVLQRDMQHHWSAILLGLEASRSRIDPAPTLEAGERRALRPRQHR